jgi:acetyltransferase-like isoleucine patch superfamily enzyme
MAAVLRRAMERIRVLRGGAPIDPVTGGPWGALSLQVAEAAGIATVGRHSYGGPTFHVWPGQRSRLRVGAFCSFAPDVQIFGGGRHNVDWVTTYPLRIRWELPGAHIDGHPVPGRDVTIGNDVWVGTEAMIFDGVTIGDGAVVAARSVVTKDVRPYAIVGGNPARELRRRFDDDQVGALLALRWWDWPDELIRERAGELCSPDVGAFLDRHG